MTDVGSFFGPSRGAWYTHAMPRLVWLNGETFPLESATTSVADHAHLYGDGLFEGIRIYHSRVFKLDEHLARLYHGCKYLGFDMTISPAQMRQIVLDTCAASEITEGYIRLNVTRGSGLGLDPRAVKTAPNVMVMVSTLALYPEEAYETGLTAITSSYRVIPPDSLDPRVKCIGRYANNILAKLEANRAGAGEAIMLNHQGEVAEGTGDNVFIIKDGVVLTPQPTSGILQGITHDTVMKLLSAEYPVHNVALTRYDLLGADEAFFTGTAAEVIPMVSLDQRPIGDGKPGPVTKRAMELFREHTHTGVPFSVAHAAAGQ